MTRFAITPRVPRSTHFGLAEAFQFLGACPSYPQLDLAVDLLRQSGVEDVAYDDQLVQLAIDNGSNFFTALDLQGAFHYGTASLTSGGGASR